MFNKLKNKAEKVLAKIAQAASKAKSVCNAAVLAAGALVCSAQVHAQEAGLKLPATAEADLKGYITDNFPVVIGVVVVIVGATLLIRFIKKAG
jgi:hypothetical protein